MSSVNDLDFFVNLLKLIVLNFESLFLRSPSTCPTTPSPSTPASNSPTSTPKHSCWHPTNAAMSKHMSWSPGHVANSSPKHSVHFHDPQLLKDGVLVTKVRINSDKIAFLQLACSNQVLHMGQFLQGGKNGHLMSFFFKSRASV